MLCHLIVKRGSRLRYGGQTMKPDKTALLVMDYQNDIVHENGKFAAWGLAAHVQQQKAIENTAAMLTKARKAGVKVLYIKVEHARGYPEIKNSKIGMYQGMKEAGALIEGEWGAQIHDAVKPLQGEKVLVKRRINPFTIPTLEAELQGMETLLLAGVATNFVLEECARTAAANDYEVIVLEDCCASLNQAMHDFPIKNILPNLVIVTNSKEVTF